VTRQAAVDSANRVKRYVPSKHHAWLVLVVLVALAARTAVYVADPKPAYLTGLAVYQGEMARNIVDHGKWFVLNRRALEITGREMVGSGGRLVDPEQIDFSEAEIHANYEPEILEMPGVAVVLAGLWVVTGAERYSYLRFLQIGLDVIMVLLVYFIAIRLTEDRNVALAASAVYALWPPALVLAKTPSLDTWAVFFAIASLALFLARSDQRRGPLLLVALGVVVGISLYFRPLLIVLPLAFAFAEARRQRWRQPLATALIPLSIAALLLVPWSVRNYGEFGRFLPTRTGLGQALWEGLGETPNNFGAVNNDKAAVAYVHARRPDLVYPSPSFDDFLLQRSLDAIADHPLHYLGLLARRAIYLAPCLLALTWRRRYRSRAVLPVATAAAIVLPYVFLRMEDRFWLPAGFLYIILVCGAAASAREVLQRRR
jgi:4-amino-4-deoxy-L-arabinose transferase-like glycosyltransferase